ncbi:hypothetical protein HaLaN_03363 [Haematococcus lacustris]|uniref:Uncharacterized protein n=1 Tax=Haematococcus lacustris TaxID=44745 RepID=A0A699YE37_HAELA|nr:hypothetical protein HaLaN_03363 [Haematococcus lacustris]
MSTAPPGSAQLCMANSHVRKSWTMSSPPSLLAGGPQQGRCTSACCAQPGASSVISQCGA